MNIICTRRLLPLLLATLLAACGGGDLAGAYAPAVTRSTPGDTPFVQVLQLSGMALSDVASIGFTITPRAGTASRAVRAMYSREYLQRRGWISNAGATVAVPVVGLYAGHGNEVQFTVTYVDSSSDQFTITVSTAAYVDPTGVLSNPRAIKARAPGTDLGVDFVMMKPTSTPPVVVDTDGHIRWSGGATGPGRWATWTDNGFVAGENNSTRFRRYELDGSSSDGQLSGGTIQHTAFHHNIDKGPNGLLLGETDALDNGVAVVESVVVEFNAAGVISKEWDFAKIVGNYMRASGDDPSNFVRPGVDWFHTNAVAYDPRDHSLVVSAREDFVVKVGYDSGEIIWILGDPTKHWYSYPSLRAKALTLPAGQLYPIGQHSLSFNSDGQLMMFNNGGPSFNQPSGAPVGESRAFSAVSAYTFDLASRSATEVWNFDYGKTIRSDVCSSAYEGRNKSLLVVYSVASSRTKLHMVGLNAAREVAFDLEYNTTVCDTSWNSEPVPFDDLRFMR